MRYYKMLVAVLLIPCILYFLCSPISWTVSAADLDSQNELIGYIEETLDISVSYEKETDYVIKSFDINEDGWYAINNAVGYANNTIQVYDSMGVFQYAYHFRIEGAYGFILKENSIIIYLVRGNIAAEIDSTGKCIAAEKVILLNGELDDVLDRTYKQIGEVSYYLERDIGLVASDYSRLIKIDEEGTKTILYDVTTLGYFVGASHYLVLGLFLILGIKAFRDMLKEDEEVEEDG